MRKLVLPSIMRFNQRSTKQKCNEPKRAQMTRSFFMYIFPELRALWRAKTPEDIWRAKENLIKAKAQFKWLKGNAFDKNDMAVPITTSAGAVYPSTKRLGTISSKD